jgi:RNA polymerase sigma factor (sigma-70 family)
MSSTLDWANLFEEEAPRLIRFLRRFGPRVSAEDIAQDAFVKLVDSQADNITSPRAYLTATARNLALNDIRRQTNSKTDACADIDAIAADHTADPEAQLIAAEQASAADAALNGLAPDLKEALLLHLVEGLNQPQVAARLGVSRRTVQRRIAEALAQLHARLAAYDNAL